MVVVIEVVVLLQDEVIEVTALQKVVIVEVHHQADTKVVNDVRVRIVHHAVRVDTKEVDLVAIVVTDEDIEMGQMVHLVHHVVITQIVHVHQEVNNKSLAKILNILYTVSNDSIFMPRSLLREHIKTFFFQAKSSTYWEKIKKLPMLLKYVIGIFFVLF